MQIVSLRMVSFKNNFNGLFSIYIVPLFESDTSGFFALVRGHDKGSAVSQANVRRQKFSLNIDCNYQ
jgi:hypothetical protein